MKNVVSTPQAEPVWSWKVKIRKSKKNHVSLAWAVEIFVVKVMARSGS
jgi:hypothetical protein